jgi:hypothetical protein
MHRPPDLEMRRAATTNGSPNRNSKPSASSSYNHGSKFSTLFGRSSSFPNDAPGVMRQEQNSIGRLRAGTKLIAHLNDRWRVVECAGGIQWILQRRAGERHGTARWDDRSYCRTKEALIRCCRASVGEIEPGAATALATLPERFTSRAGDDPTDKMYAAPTR